MTPVFITEERYLHDQSQLYVRLDRLASALEQANMGYLADKAAAESDRAARAEADLALAVDQRHQRKMGWFGLVGAVFAGSLPPTMVSLFA